MAIRTSKRIVTFCHPFRLKSVDHVLPAGEYTVLTDDELIEGLAFPVYRRVSTVIVVPGQSRSSSETFQIDSSELAAARRDAGRDAAGET